MHYNRRTKLYAMSTGLDALSTSGFASQRKLTRNAGNEKPSCEQHPSVFTAIALHITAGMRSCAL